MYKIVSLISDIIMYLMKGQNAQEEENKLAISSFRSVCQELTIHCVSLTLHPAL